MKIGIVGASQNWWDGCGSVKKSVNLEFTIRQIIYGLLMMPDAVLVSGGCPKGGVDLWAEQIADANGKEKIIFKPKTEDRIGYMGRNRLIAENCDVLYDIEPMGRDHSGGMATFNMAKKLGKETHKISVT